MPGLHQANKSVCRLLPAQSGAGGERGAVMKRTCVEAVLLAAGYSSRMGELKPLLPLGGTTVIRRQVEMLQSVADRIIVVTGYRGEEVEHHLSGSGAYIVQNPRFGEGMFTSVKAGIRSLKPKTDAFLILPVDYPLVTGRMIRQLLKVYEGSRDCLVAYPSYRMRKGHPPVISASCTRQILAYDGELGLKGALKAFDGFACYMETEDMRCVMDMDTPADYRKILAALAVG